MKNQKVVIVGAGQAGLAAGRELGRRGIPFTILDADSEVGQSWRERWDSLTIFTPARYSGLPGRPLTGPKGHTPTKDDVADYLQAYARQFELPIRSGVRVSRLSRDDRGFALETTDGPMRADAVIIATGTNTWPNVPGSSIAINPAIVQLHSSEYRNPNSVPRGDVLVVGAGTSGTQLALELSKTHRVTIAGRPTPTVSPVLIRFLGGVQWFVVNRLLTRSTPMGRKAAVGFFHRGAPLIGVGVPDLDRAGVDRTGRFSGVENGLPVVDGAGVLSPASIIWATGYRPGFDWIEDLRLDENGWPATTRGVAKDAPGLYFVGMPFQYAVSSGLLGGVGRDAAFVADRLAGHLALSGSPRIPAGAKS